MCAASSWCWSEPMGARLAALAIADPPERWEALGFTVSEGGRLALGGLWLKLGVPGRGITEWTLAEVEGDGDIDGLSTTITAAAAPASVEHDNGAVALDHVVIVTPDFERTAATLQARGMPLRRESERAGRRQGFRRLGPAIMEIVEAPEAEGPARFWGLVVVVEDLDALSARLGSQISRPRPAVQPGRRIATLKTSAGLSPQVAFMDQE